MKDVDRLEAAYDDAAGVTAEFNLNVLRVMNRELEADFELDQFAHLARYDRDEEWIEMRLRSLADQTVHIRALDLEVDFARGEEVRTEISAKFRRAGVEAELAAAGLQRRALDDRPGRRLRPQPVGRGLSVAEVVVEQGPGPGPEKDPERATGAEVDSMIELAHVRQGLRRLDPSRRRRPQLRRARG